MIYFFTILLLLVFIIRYDINGKKLYRDKCYLLMLVIFILLAGLRWRVMMDTPNYIYYFYYIYPSLNEFTFEDYPIGKDPFYVLINSLVKSLGGRFYWVQLIEAAFVNILVFKYFKRHCNYIFTCLFFYAFTCYLGYSMETMRAGFSFVLCLYANDYILDKKWIKGYLLFILALMFHAQTIVMFVVPILFFMRFNKIGLIMCVCALILGFVVQRGLGTYLELLEMFDSISDKASMYAGSDKYGTQGGNLNFYIVRIFPNLFYSLFCLFYLKKFHPDSKVLKVEPFIMCGVFFLLIQMSMQIAYRYVDYFRIFFIIFYAETFIMIIHDSKILSRSLATIRALIVFLPFILLVGYSMYLSAYTFYPYSSVIDRRIIRQREWKYEQTDKITPYADIDEY